jgi:hypothetical protein
MIKEDHMHHVLIKRYSHVVQREGFVPSRIHRLVRTHKCYMAVSECVDMFDTCSLTHMCVTFVCVWRARTNVMATRMDTHRRFYSLPVGDALNKLST